MPSYAPRRHVTSPAFGGVTTALPTPTTIGPSRFDDDTLEAITLGVVIFVAFSVLAWALHRWPPAQRGAARLRQVPGLLRRRRQGRQAQRELARAARLAALLPQVAETGVSVAAGRRAF
jgi:hypothetical protein